VMARTILVFRRMVGVQSAIGN